VPDLCREHGISTATFYKLDLSRIHAALIAHLGCLAFESQGAFASQR
jgi:hypothetical protein